MRKRAFRLAAAAVYVLVGAKSAVLLWPIDVPLAISVVGMAVVIALDRFASAIWGDGWRADPAS